MLHRPGARHRRLTPKPRRSPVVRSNGVRSRPERELPPEPEPVLMGLLELHHAPGPDGTTIRGSSTSTVQDLEAAHAQHVSAVAGETSLPRLRRASPNRAVPAFPGVCGSCPENGGTPPAGNDRRRSTPVAGGHPPRRSPPGPDPAARHRNRARRTAVYRCRTPARPPPARRAGHTRRGPACPRVRDPGVRSQEPGVRRPSTRGGPPAPGPADPADPAAHPAEKIGPGSAILTDSVLYYFRHRADTNCATTITYLGRQGRGPQGASRALGPVAAGSSADSRRKRGAIQEWVSD